MLLYEHPLSSYAQKIKIALREKGVPFTRPSCPTPSAPAAATAPSPPLRPRDPAALRDGIIRFPWPEG